jgi:hypothetical protein
MLETSLDGWMDDNDDDDDDDDDDDANVAGDRFHSLMI